ncbi:MAG: histidinol-phosphate transaminase [Bacteroidales bacterium]
MKFDPESIARPNILKMTPYSSARDEYSGKASIFLDANENPFNSPYNRYPDPHQRELKKQVSELFSLPVQNIFLGNGSDEAIDLLFRVFCEPAEDNVVAIHPSYGMYAVCAAMNNIEIRKVLLKPDYSLDSEAIIDSTNPKTKMIFLCSPNNPTGNLMDIDEVVKLLKAFKGLVVMDEAYIDFARTDGVLPYLNEYQNLVILRTFSKAWGLAGIRLGMAFASESIIKLMAKVKYPYNLNILTQEFAIKTITDRTRRDQWIEEIIEERENMKVNLGNLPIVEKIYPSDANFLLVKVDNPQDLYSFLKEKGIIVRDRSRVDLCEGSLRITIGTREENRELLKELKNYIEDR